MDLFYFVFVFAIVSCLCHAAWEMDDFFALLYVMFSCEFVTFPYCMLGQLWYLIVSSPDLCHLPYFYNPEAWLQIPCHVITLLRRLTFDRNCFRLASRNIYVK